MINGVEIKELITHPDDRGFFREIIRVTDDSFADGFGQWSHSLMFDNVIKAWHYHKIQTDWWYVVAGVCAWVCTTYAVTLRLTKKPWISSWEICNWPQSSRFLLASPTVARQCRD